MQKKSFGVDKFLLLGSIIMSILIFTQCKTDKKPSDKKKKTTTSFTVTNELIRGILRDSIAVTGKDSVTRIYEGASLARLLDREGFSSAKLKPKELVKYYLVVRGTDGFEAVFSLAEIDTAFSGKNVIIADRVNGEALPADRGPFQLIAKGDLRPTRNCYQLKQLILCEAKTETE